MGVADAVDVVDAADAGNVTGPVSRVSSEDIGKQFLT